MTIKKSKDEAIEDLTLALMYLTSFPDDDIPYYEMFWKNYDFDMVDQLDEKDLIFDPKRRRGRSKYAFMTEAGRKRAKAFLKEMGIEDKGLYEKFEFRNIKPEEADEAADIESACFSPEEACSRKNMKERIEAASDFFLVAIDKETGKMAGFLNGLATNEDRLRDEFFTDASLHDPKGRNIILTGLAILPEYRHMGLARELMFEYCRTQKERGTEKMVLTCVNKKVKMYKKMGFSEYGESASMWGGHPWHEMGITLNYDFNYEMD